MLIIFWRTTERKREREQNKKQDTKHRFIYRQFFLGNEISDTITMQSDNLNSSIEILFKIVFFFLNCCYTNWANWVRFRSSSFFSASSTDLDIVSHISLFSFDCCWCFFFVLFVCSYENTRTENYCCVYDSISANSTQRTKEKRTQHKLINEFLYFSVSFCFYYERVCFLNCKNCWTEKLADNNRKMKIVWLQLIRIHTVNPIKSRIGTLKINKELKIDKFIEYKSLFTKWSAKS